ncbi:MAG: hypothetical protein ACREQI_14055 [Candidatus Binataceae bacterium]
MKRRAPILLLAMLAGCRLFHSGPTRVQMAFAAARLCGDLKRQPFIPGLPVAQQDLAATGAAARDIAKQYQISLAQGADVIANALRGRGKQTLAQYACGAPSFPQTPKPVARVKLADGADPRFGDERQVANGCAAVMQFFRVKPDAAAEICAADLLVNFPIYSDRAKLIVQWSATPPAAPVTSGERQAARSVGCALAAQTIQHPNAAEVPKPQARAHRAASDFAIAGRLGIPFARADLIYQDILQTKAATLKDSFCGSGH